MKDSEKIILYWSGEADDALAREVEALLDSDESARRYLHELNGFGAVMRDTDVPAPRAGLLEEVLEEVLEEQARSSRVIEFPKRMLWAAAAIALLAVVLSTLYQPSREASLPVVVQAPATDPAAPEVITPTLSERILAGNTSFRDSHDRLKQSFRQRSRWHKL